MRTNQTSNRESKLNSQQRLVGIRILLVEDEPDIADLLIFILQTAGAEVMALINAETAFAILESFYPNNNIRLTLYTTVKEWYNNSNYLIVHKVEIAAALELLNIP